MPATGSDSYVPLFETDRPDRVSAVGRALDDRGIPYRSGLLASEPPQVLFSVPAERLGEARATIRSLVRHASLDELDDDPEDDESEASQPAPPAPARLPWRPMLVVGAVVLLHLVLVAVATWLVPQGPRAFWRMAGLVRGITLEEPWRLLTSLFVHSGLRHVMSNALSMMVFAVPLIGELGYRRTALVYLAAGVGGGMTAMALAAQGTTVIGSSGAVAGVFGAWIVLALRRVWAAEPLGWRGRIRVIGVALLVLPSFLAASTPDGHSISVSSHIGGLASGMAIGAILSRTLMAAERRDPGEGSSPTAT